MRTSASQFQLMVDFMERYGDLSKPTEGPQGRATNIQRWAELTQHLNADATGDTKTAEKWRKVWSDFKNNIKKKAARIHRHGQGTGGGPSSTLKLNDLEQKVISLIGTQAATGIVIIPEIGVEDEVTEPPPENNSQSIIIDNDSTILATDWNCPGTSSGPTSFPPVGVTQPLIEPGAVPRPPSIPQQEGQFVMDQSSTPLPVTPRRRRRGRMLDQSSPINRRTRTQTQSDLARQAFVRSDCEWRAFQQENERERNRLRESELRAQERWLDLFGQFLLLGDRFINILEKKIRE